MDSRKETRSPNQKKTLINVIPQADLSKSADSQPSFDHLLIDDTGSETDADLLHKKGLIIS